VHSEESSHVNHGQSCTCDKHTPASVFLLAACACMYYIVEQMCGLCVQNINASASEKIRLVYHVLDGQTQNQGVDASECLVQAVCNSDTSCSLPSVFVRTSWMCVKTMT